MARIKFYNKETGQWEYADKALSQGSSQNANNTLTFTGAVEASYDGSEEVTINIPEGSSDYELPIGGEELGGVKNGGNVVINADGTMTAPVSEVTDEQVTAAVSGWLAANPDATTTVQDCSITQEKLSDELVSKLGLEPNHHLTEESIPLYIAKYNSWEPLDGNSATRCTAPFKTAQYIRVKNNSTVTVQIYGVRYVNEANMDSETFIVATHKRNLSHVPSITLAAGEDITFQTFEYGRMGCEYMQIQCMVGGSYGTKDLFEVTAIYDDFRPTYELPDDSGLYLEDLPMRWVYQGYNNVARSNLYCVVPYYPDFTYNVRGGYMSSVLVNTVSTVYLLDDSIFNQYDLGLTHNSGNVGHIPLICAAAATQYDTTVNGGRDQAYNWCYHTTPPESELTGPKWVAFEMGILTQDTKGDLGIDYYNSLIAEKNEGDTRNQYVTRWTEQIPRRILTQIVKRNGSIQDEGTRYRELFLTGDSPLANAKWVLFGDSLTDNYGGKDYGSEYFASKIAREFGMNLDNRAKSGSNIYKGGSGNYVNVSGIVMLDAYLAEIEAGTVEQADYITVAFGTNTFTAQLGTNDDTSATNTSVYGATKYFIEKIREKVPNAVLGFVLSPRQNWGSADPGGSRSVDGGRAAIKAVCDDYGVPYIDMSTQSGITVGMLPDGIHISNAQSQKLYYHAMRRFMMGL